MELPKGFWVYLIIFLFVIYALYKERQFLGCKTIPDGSDCDNPNGKAVKGSEPLSSDDSQTLLNKIDFASKYTDREVVWRRSVIFSFIAIVMYAYLIYAAFPSAYHLFCGILIMAAVMYFSFNFYKYHMSDYIKNNIQASTDILRNRIK